MDQATYTLYVDSPTTYSDYVLQLPVAPIVSITSIHSDTGQKYDSDSLVDSSTYSFNAQYGQVILDPNTATKIFESGFRSNKVVCVIGYTSITAPQDLDHAVCVWIAQLHRNKSTQGKEHISQGGSTVRVSPKRMPDEVKEFLYQLRVPGLLL